MYIWTGIDVDSQLSDIKSQVKLVEESIGFNNSNFLRGGQYNLPRCGKHNY